ncbi:fibronectin type III domain-containing protein [Paenibacillus sp. Dod16]
MAQAYLTNTSYTFTSLTPNTTYNFTVMAKRQQGYF